MAGQLQTKGSYWEKYLQIRNTDSSMTLDAFIILGYPRIGLEENDSQADNDGLHNCVRVPGAIVTTLCDTAVMGFHVICTGL